MGYSTLLDVMGSLIIAGFISLMVIRANGSISMMNYTYGQDMNVQKGMTTLIEMVEYDFRKIGYCEDPDKFPYGAWAIREAGNHNFTFLADIDFDKTVDTIKYYTGTKHDARSTSNPRDFPLYRTVNNSAPMPMYLGATQFDFEFFDWEGAQIDFPIPMDSASLSGIFSIRLTVLLESTEAYDSVYTYSYWRQLRLSSRNQINR